MPELDHRPLASGEVDEGIVCTQCGGEIEPRIGSKFLRCNYCDTTLFIDRAEIVQHYRIPELIDEQDARASLHRWMAGNDTVKDLDRKSTIQEAVRKSFPVWYFRVAQSGGEQVFVQPAAAILLPQLGDLKIPAGRLEPYREDEESVTSIDVSVQLETARAWLEQQGSKKVLETALVRLPLWSYVYTYSAEEYRAYVDAATGSVLATVYPEKAESPYLLIALLGAGLFGLEGLLISNIAVKSLVFFLTAVPMTLLAFWIARKV